MAAMPLNINPLKRYLHTSTKISNQLYSNVETIALRSQVGGGAFHFLPSHISSWAPFSWCKTLQENFRIAPSNAFSIRRVSVGETGLHVLADRRKNEKNAIFYVILTLKTAEFVLWTNLDCGPAYCQF